MRSKLRRIRPIAIQFSAQHRHYHPGSYEAEASGFRTLG